ncbi:pyruvate formate-lyase-activating protein [Cellulosispirillum alkaliphilum]|uniref:pyruvate formate-lyase-activating protein n=1 Tax=Cellulosispirillum alkaliphilum TaxID=3039283 RepID=UPI003D6EE04B
MARVGTIHSIETFGTVDGPGIRYTIFFQGCPLRCRYCHNRDTWNTEGGRQVTIDELLEEIEQYRPFLESSGGGVTATGGEPLLQAEFLCELFSELKAREIHTALDTSGFTAITPVVRQLLEVTDLVLLDIKHIDEEKHKKLTCVSNGWILEFAQYLSRNNKTMWIRHVVLEGYFEDDQSDHRLAEFVRKLSNVERVELLPYHSMGAFKWEALGLEYPLEGIEPPSAEKMEAVVEIFRAHGIEVTV